MIRAGVSYNKTNIHEISLCDQPELRLRECSHNNCHFDHFEIKYKQTNKHSYLCGRGHQVLCGQDRAQGQRLSQVHMFSWQQSLEDDSMIKPGQSSRSLPCCYQAASFPGPL